LPKGRHTFSIAYREGGADLDKICISNIAISPAEIGDTAENICTPDTTTVGVTQIETGKGYGLGQNYPNPFHNKSSISFEIPESTYVSLKVTDILGTEIRELAGKFYHAGKHTVKIDNLKLAKGNYFYTLKTDKFSATRKMIKLEE
jgi:hypothetical protein